ncbi:Hypothetical predicted protein [Paramuricea clavata]|uniref:Uncharacterized protein n=1 Tax=Paramuricea clavata TaxID=317549 RepID=A0A6S7H3E5_PARCT|nr:Hypothetical predicted protein [Paramuricea clavata]
MFLELGSPQLTHELLVTLMAEITGIINSRPIVVVPSDIDQPQPLTPNMLLTMKTRPLLPPPGVFTPEDVYLRYAKIAISRDGEKKVYYRPINEFVPIIHA